MDILWLRRYVSEIRMKPKDNLMKEYCFMMILYDQDRNSKGYIENYRGNTRIHCKLFYSYQ